MLLYILTIEMIEFSTVTHNSFLRLFFANTIGRGRNMSSTAATLGASVLKKAIDRYYKQLQDYKGRADYELAIRTAFLNLLNETAHQVKWMLIPEQTIEGSIRPDGVLRDSFDLKRGFWEAKGPKSDLDKEIARKIATRYPLTNTIFENTN